MSNIQRLLAGQKRESAVWKYFNYIELPNQKDAKCRCIVVKNGKQCGILLAGKNPTNMKKHLARFHEDASADVEKCDADKNQLKSVGALSSVSSRVFKNQSIAECLNRKLTKWPSDSNEYRSRLDALAEVFISTGYPMSLLDNPAFQAFIKSLDPKFTAPG